MNIAYQQAKAIRLVLSKEYPRSRTILRYNSPFQLLVAVILSAQCRDVRVNLVTDRLFQDYQTVQDFASMDYKTLERYIYSTGFYKTKARYIINAARVILKDFAGIVPNNMQDLLILPGVARKTANVVLSEVFQKEEGIAVDTHVMRLVKLLGLSSSSSRDTIEQDLMRCVDREYWSAFSNLLIFHGRKVCIANRPCCNDCVVRLYCNYARCQFE